VTWQTARGRLRAARCRLLGSIAMARCRRYRSDKNQTNLLAVSEQPFGGVRPIVTVLLLSCHYEDCSLFQSYDHDESKLESFLTDRGLAVASAFEWVRLVNKLTSR
jgi:hypothetical protein